MGLVSASEQTKTTLTAENASLLDVSQNEFDIQNDTGGNVERIYESSANEQNSLNNLQETYFNENSSSAEEKLGVGAEDMLGNVIDGVESNHNYTYDPFHGVVVTHLNGYSEVSGGVKGGNIEIHIYTSPIHPVVGSTFHLVVDVKELKSSYSGKGVSAVINGKSYALTRGDDSYYWWYTDVLITSPVNTIEIKGSAIKNGVILTASEGFYVYKNASISLNIDNDNINVGDTVKLIPNIVDSDGNPIKSGIVVYYYANNGTYLGNSSADGSLEYKGSISGNFSFYATYEPETSNVDNLYKPGTSNEVNLTVNKKLSPSTIDINDIQYVYGSTGSTTLTYSGANGVDAYVYTLDGTMIKELTPSANSISVSDLNAGTYKLVVATKPDANHCKVTVNKTITVDKASSQIIVTGGIYEYDSTITVTVTLVNSTGFASYDILDGTTSVLNKITNFGYTKNGDVWIATFKGLSVGNYTVSISNRVNDNYIANTAEANINITKATPELTLTLNSDNEDNANSLHNGNFDLNYTHTIKITPTLTNGATGNITYTFNDGNTASYVKNYNEVFEYTPENIVTSSRDTIVTAVYSGNANYNPVTVNKTFHISRHDVVMTLTLNDTDNVKVGDKILITPTVKVDNNNVLFGTVIIKVNGDAVGELDLSSKTSYEYTADNNGEKTITAEYVKNKYYRAATAGTDAFNVKAVTVLSISLTNVTYGTNSTATIKSNAPGTVDVIIAGKRYSLSFTEEGTKTISLKLAAKDNYEASVSFNESDNYTGAYASTNFKVDKQNLSVSGYDKTTDWASYTRAIWSISNLPADANYTYKFYDSNEQDVSEYIYVSKYDSTSNRLTFRFGNGLKADVYTLYFSIGNENYTDKTIMNKFTINPSNSSINGLTDISFVYGDSGSTNLHYSGASDVNIIILRNGSPVTANITRSDGKLLVSGLDVGNYTLDVTTVPDENHTEISKSCNIEVSPAKSTIIIGEIIKVYDDIIQFTVQTTNATGLSSVVIKKDGVEITGFSVSNYTVTLNDFDVGEYDLEITTQVDSNHAQNTTTGSLKIVPAESKVTINPITAVVYNNDVIIRFNVENRTVVTYTVKSKDGVKTIVENRVISGDEITLNNLSAGNYTIIINNAKMGNYNANESDATFEVKKAGSNVSIPDFDDYKYGTDNAIEINHENTDGIKVTLDSKEDYVSVDGYNIIIGAGLAVGEHTLKVIGIGDENHTDCEDSYTFNVLRVDKVWISPEGTGLGVNENNPTTWDKVADILTNNGTVIFTNGIYDNLHSKVIDNPWTITSNGNATIDANNANQIFVVDSDDVTIEKLVFKNAFTNQGGAIRWTGSNGQISNSIFINNTAVDWGGAMYVTGDGLTITDCDFINNTGKYAGAVKLEATAIKTNIYNSNFINNSATDLGGAIEWLGRLGNIQNSNFINNSANYSGGAMAIQYDPDLLNGLNQIVSYCNFINNSAEYAGAIDWYGYNGTIYMCNFTNNSAGDEGGAIYCEGDNLTILWSNFIDNSAGEDGGAIYTEGENGVFNETTFKNNVAQDYRNIFTKNTLILENSTLDAIITINQVENCPFNSTVEITGTIDEGTNIKEYSVLILNKGIPVGFAINNYSYTWDNLNVGNYSITLNMDNTKGNTYASNYDAMNFTVYKANSSIIINDIKEVVYGENTLINFTVVNATSVSWIINDKNNNSWNISGSGLDNITQKLNAGVYTITITNAENGNFNASNACVEFSVAKAGSSVVIGGVSDGVYDTVDATVNYNVINETAVTFTIKKGNDVIVEDKDISYLNVELSKLVAGEYTITITNAENSNFNASSACVEFSVAKAGSSVVIGGVSDGVYDTIDATVNYNVINETVVTFTVKKGNDVIVDDKDINYLNVELSKLVAGNYTIVISNAENDNFNKSSDTIDFEIKKAGSDVSVPDNIVVVYDDSVIICVDNLVNASGVTVALYNGNTWIKNLTVNGNDIIVNASNVNAGGYTLIVTTIPESDNYYAINKTGSVLVTKASSSVIVPESYGSYNSQISIEVQVINNTSPIEVKIYDENGSEITPRINIEGHKIIISSLEAGNYSLNVSVGEDTNFNASSDVNKIHVSKIDSGFKASTIRNEITYLENITIYHSFNNPDANGKIIYYLDNGTTVEKNKGEYVTYFPTFAGKHNITVKYVGDNNFNESTSIVSFDVNPRTNSSFYVKVDNRVIDYHQNTTLTPTVQNGATGNVTFKFDDYNETVTVKIGDAYVYVPKYAGSHKVIATYNGDNNFVSNTREFNITVNRINSGFKLDDGNTFDMDFGNNVTIYSRFGYNDVTGKINLLLSNNTLIENLNVNDSVTYSPYKAGYRILNATYSGDINYLPASDTLTIKVNRVSAGFDARADNYTIDYQKGTIILGNVTNPKATGNVTYTFSDNTDSINVSVGTSFEYIPKSAGTHHITVDYSGDENFISDKKEITIIVNKIDAGFNVTADKNNIIFEDIIHLNSSAINSNATGNVTYIFDDGSKDIVSGIGGIVSYVPKMAGNRTVTVVYSGDGNFNEVTKTIKVFVAKSADAGFNAIATPDMIPFKNSTTLSTWLDNNNATGTVSYYFDDADNVTGVRLGTQVYKPLSAGIHNVTVKYSGDDNFNASEIVIKINVTKIDAGFDAFTRRNNITYLDSITLFHRFGDADANGKIIYYLDNGTTVEKSISESVTYVPTFAGEHNVTVKYVGDNNFNESIDIISFNVTKSQNSGFDFWFTDNTIFYEQNTVIKSNLSNKNATGNVTYIFDDGFESIVNVTVGVDQTYIPLLAGVRSVTAIYSGDSNYKGVTMTRVLTVSEIGAGFGANSNKYTIDYQENVILNTSVIHKNATGNVTFIFDDGTESIMNISIGQIVDYRPKLAGTRNITVKYSGDENYENTTITIHITVNKIDAGFKVICPDSIDFETNATLIGNVSNRNASGNVTYKFENGTELTSLGDSVTYIPEYAGTHHITVTYSGDDNFNGITMDLKIEVNKIDAGFNASVNSTGITFENAVSLNSSAVNPKATGNVTYKFDDGSNDFVAGIGDIVSYVPIMAGNRTITVVYSGDGNFNGTTKTIKVFVAKSADAGFNAIATPDVIPFKNSTTLHTWLDNNNATGTVSYYFDDADNVTGVSLGTQVYKPLSAGIHNVTVKYSGDDNFNSSEIVIKINVTKIDAGFDAYTIRNAVDYLKNIILYHTFGYGDVTGKITYYLDNGTAVEKNITESVTYFPTFAGKHNITVKYSGDNNFIESSDVIYFDVNRSDNAVFFVNVDNRVINYRQNTTLTPTVQNGAMGNVTFKFDDYNETVTVNIGESYVYVPKYAGIHKVIATYNGDNNFLNNTRQFNITVNRINSGFALDDGNVTKMIFGNNVSIHLIADYDDVYGNITLLLSNGTVVNNLKIGDIVTYSPYKAGYRVLNATYSGNINYLPSNNTLSIYVDPSDDSGFYADAAPKTINFGNKTLVWGNVTNPKASGNVTYIFDYGDPITVPVGTYVEYIPKSAGPHHIIVDYNGDGNFNSAKADVYINVTKIDAGFKASANATSIIIGESLKLNASVLNSKATGDVTYIFDDDTMWTSVSNITGAVIYTPKLSGLRNITVEYDGDDNFNKSKVIIQINVIPKVEFNVTVNNVDYPNNASVEIESNVDGNYTVNINNKDYNVTITNKTGKITFDLLTPGNYTVNITSNILNYHNKSELKNLEVKNGTLDFNVIIDNANYPNNGVVKIESDVDGNYTVLVNNKNYTVTVKDGKGNVTIDLLDVGKYPVTITSNIDNYENIVKNDSLMISNGTVSVNVTVVGPVYPVNGSVIVNASVDGNYSVKVGNESYVVEVINGTGNVTLPVLPVGDYNVTVEANITNYGLVHENDTLTVANGTVDFNVTVSGVSYPDCGVVSVVSDVDGNFTVNVGDKNYTITVRGGKGNVTVDQLTPNTYPVNVTPNIPNYNNSSKNSELTVLDGILDFNVTVNNATYPDVADVVIVADVDGNYTVFVNNKNYTVTVKDGKGNVTIDLLDVGKYPITITSNIDNYRTIVKNDSLMISNGTVSVNVTVVGPVYPVNGSVIVNASVDGNYSVKVGNESYVVEVINGTGNVTLPVLPVGDYNVTVEANITNYGLVHENDTLTVANGTVDFNVTVSGVSYPDCGVVSVVSDVDGNFTVNVGDKNYTVIVRDGKGNVTVDQLSPNTYPVTVTPDIPNYGDESKSDSLTVSNGTVDFNVTVSGVSYPDCGVVSVVSDVDGNFTVNVGDKNYTVIVRDGKGNVTVDQLSPNTYPVTVTPDIPNYGDESKSDSLTVSNGTVSVNVTVVGPVYPVNGSVVVNASVDGNYSVKVGNESYVVEVINGAGNVTLPVLPVGDYNVTVEANITNYNPIHETKNITVSEGTINFNVTVSDASYPDCGVVSVVSDVDGNFTVNVGDKNYTITVRDGKGNVTVDQLIPGSYPVNVTSDIPNYKNITKTDSLKISKGTPNFNITIDNPTYPSNAKVIIDADVDGEYIVEVNNKTYSITVHDGIGTAEIDQLPVGDYPVNVTSNITDYGQVSKNKELTVRPGKIDVNLTVEDVVYPNKPTVTVKANVDGKYLLGVGNKEYDVEVVNGIVTIELEEMLPNDYRVFVVSKVENYEEASDEDNLTVSAPKTSVSEKVVNVNVKLTFKTSKGTLLKNQKVTFNFNGKTYSVKTNKKGQATIVVKKAKSNSGVVNLKQIIVDKKVYKHKIAKIKYTAKFTNAKGKPLIGKKVVIKFKGKTYKVKTNKKGIASFTLKNLKKGKYDIVAYYQNTYYKTTIQIKK